MTTELKIKNQIMNEMFSDRPFKEDDWEVFMQIGDHIDESLNKKLLEDFLICEKYGFDPIDNIQAFMLEQLENYNIFVEKISIKKIYEVAQYNIWFEYSSKVVFGYFDSYDTAYETMLKGFEKLYPSFIKDLYFDGKNQWTTDQFDFGVMIKEITLNEFEEI